MRVLTQFVKLLSDQPVVSIAARSLLEDGFKAIRSLIRRELRVGQGLRTLDLGCGPGIFSELFAKDDYVGVDLSLRYIAYARRKRRGVFFVSDARRLSLSPGQFDQVLIFGLLHHLSDQGALATLCEARRVLVPGGRILAIEDIPTMSKCNLVGRWVHRLDIGKHIRSVEEYRKLYTRVARIEREEIFRSGICDYYGAVLVL